MTVSKPRPVQPGYLPRDVVRLTGLPYSLLNLWAKSGFIRPSVREANGTGSERIYSPDDVKELQLASAMRKAGLGWYVIKPAINKARHYPKSRRIEVQLSTEPDIYVSITRPKEQPNE